MIVQNRLDRADLTMFRLILCDYGMREMDGLTCMKKIRSMILAQNEVKMVAKMPYICCVTAYQEKKYADEVMKAGMDDFMVKPIFKAQIHEILFRSGVQQD